MLGPTRPGTSIIRYPCKAFNSQWQLKKCRAWFGFCLCFLLRESFVDILINQFRNITVDNNMLVTRGVRIWVGTEQCSVIPRFCTVKEPASWLSLAWSELRMTQRNSIRTTIHATPLVIHRALRSLSFQRLCELWFSIFSYSYFFHRNAASCFTFKVFVLAPLHSKTFFT